MSKITKSHKNAIDNLLRVSVIMSHVQSIEEYFDSADLADSKAAYANLVEVLQSDAAKIKSKYIK